MGKNRDWQEFNKLGRYTDNCVVCKKYLKSIGEQEQSMCIECDEKTDEVSAEQLKKQLNNGESNKR